MKELTEIENKKVKVVYIIFVSLMFFITATKAQQNTVRLNQADLYAFKKRVEVMLDDFQDYLSIIGSK